jgi:hypothetical protein
MSSAQDHQPSRNTPSGARTAGTAGDARQYVPPPAPSYDEAAGPRESGASPAAAGFTIVAAVLMMVSGVWSFLEGLAAVIKGSFFVVLPNYTYNLSVTGWGWFHLILGAVVFLAGCALFTDSPWARAVGVVIASVSAIVNFLYIPYSPVWSAVLIAIDLVIIWALVSPRHGYR